MMSVRAVDFLSGWVDRRLQHTAALRCDERLGQECLAAAESAGISARELGDCPRLLARLIAEHLPNWTQGAEPRRPAEAPYSSDRPQILVMGSVEVGEVVVHGRRGVVEEAA
jgi:hypothetical protein